MAEVRQIKMSLFLMLVLQFTGAVGQFFLSINIRSGDEVVLPCENVINDQNKCDGTTWAFADPRKEKTDEMIILGQINEKANAKSDRLRVAENCSLVIKRVTAEDAGRYDCLQYSKSGHRHASDSFVYLFVITMTEEKSNDKVKLYCSVSPYEQCGRSHKVKWLFKNQGVNKDNKNVGTSQSACSASVHLKTSHYIYKEIHFLKCKVTVGDEVQLFPFILEKPGEDTKTAITKSTPTTTPTTTIHLTRTTDGASTNLKVCTDGSAVKYIMLVMRVAELLLINVITVLLFRAQGNHRPPEDHTGHHDGVGHDVTVNYENEGASSASVRFNINSAEK